MSRERRFREGARPRGRGARGPAPCVRDSPQICPGWLPKFVPAALYLSQLTPHICPTRPQSCPAVTQICPESFSITYKIHCLTRPSNMFQCLVLYFKQTTRRSPNLSRLEIARSDPCSPNLSRLNPYRKITRHAVNAYDRPTRHSAIARCARRKSAGADSS